MKKMKWMALILLVAAAGCKSNEKATVKLVGPEWQLKSMMQEGKTVKNPQEMPTLTFSDSSAVYGSAGCNRFFGKYSLGEKNAITIKPGGATMMYCPDMEFEDSYLKALAEVKEYVIRGNELKMTNGTDQWVLLYTPLDSTRLLGNSKDAHGCNGSAGYTWSEVSRECVRLFEAGLKFTAVAGDTTLAAYVIFSSDSLRAEMFLPGETEHPVLNRKTLPAGEYVWNLEDEDTYTVRKADGKWVIERQQQVLYAE